MAERSRIGAFVYGVGFLARVFYVVQFYVVQTLRVFYVLQPQRMPENATTEKFRELLNDFKRPILEQDGGGDAEQSLEHIDEVLKSLDRLHTILADAINAGGNITPSDDIERKAVISVFEKEGILPALREDPSLKEELIRILNLYLKTYPYTISTTHMKQLSANKVESSPEIPILD